jgi:hypothetical protein
MCTRIWSLWLEWNGPHSTRTEGGCLSINLKVSIYPSIIHDSMQCFTGRDCGWASGGVWRVAGC